MGEWVGGWVAGWVSGWVGRLVGEWTGEGRSLPEQPNNMFWKICLGREATRAIRQAKPKLGVEKKKTVTSEQICL